MGRSHMDNMQLLKRNWQELSSKASDVDQEVNREEMSGKKKRKSEIDNWLKDVKKLCPEIDALETRGSSWRLPLKEDPVGKLQLQVRELIDQSRHFDGFVLDTCGNIGEPCLPTKFFGVKSNEALKRIWPCLVTDDISSIGIYGMGGVGKTTLARHIEYHLLKNNNYQVLWVTVSQDFSITSLQDKIANVMGIPLSNGDEEKVRADTLRGAFNKMKRLIVLILDDVWEEFCLDRVGIPLHPNKCRLILTTRSLEVCNRMRCQRKFDLKTLDPNEAWDLFKYKLGSDTLLHGDLEDIAKSIVKECDGLPLGIITVAGSMRGVSNICEWRNALEQLKTCSIGYDEMERDVFPILEWSFKRLNECLRHCFLYCCLYPEDSDMKRKELINLFIRAELMPKRNSRSEEFDQGHTILNKLIKVCLLEESTDSKGDDCVKMHDLIRDMALRITNGNSKLKVSREDVPQFLVKSLGRSDSKVTLEQKEWTEDLHAVSFHSVSYNGAKIEVPLAWSPNCTKLSTLLLSHVSIEEIPDSFFQHMCGLKVLNLNCCKGITELPNSVSNMVNLTALILGGCEGLRSVPPPENLKQLRELDLSSTQIQDLPQGWESLVNFERLNLHQCLTLRRKIIPKGTFSQFHHLQLLLLPPYGTIQVNDPDVLNQLEIFIGCLSFTDFYKITRWPKYYNIYINDILTEDQCYDIDDCGDQKQLYFHQCQFGIGSNDLPDDMKHLLIEECEGIGIRCLSDVLKNFINLSNLSRLYIADLVGIEFLWQFSSASPRDQLEISSFSPLCGLEELRLWWLPNLVGLFYGESEPLLPVGTFSSLKQLRISGCHNMKQLFTVQLLQNLQNLEELEVKDCEGLEAIAVDGNGVGQGGQEGIQLTSSEATANVILPKLKLLILFWLPRLNNIFGAAMICDSIVSIKMLDCPNLKRLPSFLFSIDGPPYLLPAGSFSSLNELWISACHNMKQLFTVQLLQNLQNLETLRVKDCEGLEEIVADGNGVGQGGGEGIQFTSSEGAAANVILPKLRRLSLENLPQMKNVCKAAMICDSIYEIEIFGCPNLKRLPLFLSTIDGPPSLPSTLHKIRGDKEWWESLEWGNPSAKNALDTIFSTLRWDNYRPLV